MLKLLLLLACSGEGHGDGEWGEDEPERVEDPRALVEAAPLVRGSVADVLASNGSVESEAMATLMPEATGTVVAIHAEEGDKVRRGQVLAVIENASLDAGLARAEAEAAKAEAEVARVERLHDAGAVSDRDLEDARHLLSAARTSLSEAEGTQSHTRIVSPIAGTVATRDLRYGEVAGGAPAFTVVDLSALRVIVRLPERDLARLGVGQPATLTSVYDEDVEVAGHVQRISPIVDPMSGTVRVTVALDDDDQTLRPGQFVSVGIEVGRHDDVFVVPRASIVYEEGEPLVHRVRIEDEPEEEEPEDGEDGEEEEESEEPGFFDELFAGDEEVEEEEEVVIPGPYRIARKVPVEVGFVDDELAEITSGLDEGDLVLSIGHVNLRDEARVRLPEDPVLEQEDEDEADEDEADEDDGKAEVDVEASDEG
ncbi:MAG: efflux RND transporter periplasmic adaptor subunit [Proteobacteria bacterium]|nr:efflux RND transporter periplasmic adaptor subunit [Pseudomonadota bacterium]